MNCNSLSFVIFSSILMFDSCVSLKGSFEDLYKSLIDKQQDDYYKVHRINKRNAPEFRNVLIEAQNQLNENLFNNQRRVRKYKIQRKSDDTNEQIVYTEPKQSSIKSAESIQQHSMIPVYRGTASGYPSITYFNERQPSNVFYRSTQPFKRQSEEENSKNTSEEDVQNKEYEEKTDNNSKLSTDSENNDSNSYENPNNYPNLMQEYAHTVQHHGRGFHTSYFIPNIDKTIEEHKKDFKSKPINYWKSGTDQKIVKRPITSDTYISKPKVDVKPIRPVVKTVPIVKPIQYSPIVQINGYNANTYPVTAQPIIGAPVYRPPTPVEYQNLFFGYTTPHFQMSGPSVPTVSHQSKPQKNIPIKEQHKPDGQFKRLPVFISDQSTGKPVTLPPVRWTRVVAELNDQKNKVTGDWRPKPIDVYPQHNHQSSAHDRYFSVGATINMI